MVSSCVDRRDLVSASRETGGDVGGNDAVLRCSVDTLEEREHVGVRGRRLVERGKLLNDDVCVTDDLTLRVDLLRGRVVVCLRVHERARLDVLDRHLDREGRVRLDRGIRVLGEDELGRRHVGGRSNDTHWRLAGVIRQLHPTRNKTKHTGLHEPVLTCWPFVMGSLVVAQKLIKLFVDVNEADWPAVGVSWPLEANPVAITELRSAGNRFEGI